MVTRFGHGLPASGFTVVEMMIALVIAAILLTVVVPAFSDMIANGRMRSEVYSMRAMLMEARSDAMTERQKVRICASNTGTSCTGNWNEGYLAFFDTNENGAVDSGERIMQVRSGGISSITISYINSSGNGACSSNTNSNNLLFNTRGNAQVVGTNFNGTFKFCDQRGVKKAAALNVSIVGNVTAAVDTASDNIVNDERDCNIVCS